MSKRVGLLPVVLLLVLSLAAPVWAAAPGLEALVDQYLSSISSEFDTISETALWKKIQDKENLLVVDVREPAEYAVGHIQGAINIPIRELGKNLHRLPKDGTLIVIVCKTGIRAGYGTAVLRLLGYPQVRNLRGGMVAWQQANLPMVQ